MAQPMKCTDKFRMSILKQMAHSCRMERKLLYQESATYTHIYIFLHLPNLRIVQNKHWNVNRVVSYDIII